LADQILQNSLNTNITNTLVSTFGALLERRSHSEALHETNHNSAAAEIRRLVETAVNDAFALATNNQRQAKESVQETLRSTPYPTSASGFASLQENLRSNPCPNADSGFVLLEQFLPQPSTSTSLQDLRGMDLDAAGCPSRTEGGESSSYCEDSTIPCATPRDIMTVGNRDLGLFGSTFMSDQDIVNALQQGMPSEVCECIDPKTVGNATGQTRFFSLDEPISPAPEFFSFSD
jgi:hypothetical protein